MGNLRSVEKALEHVGVRALRTSNYEIACEADGLILPGVGAFPRAMSRIRELELDTLIAERARGRRPDPRRLPRPAPALRLLDRARRRERPRPARRRRRRPAGRRPQGPAHRLGRGALGARVRADRGHPVGDALLLRPLLRAAADATTRSSAPPSTASASPAPPSATTSSASSFTRRSRAPPACSSCATSRASAPAPPHPPRRDPLPGDRHPRRLRRAAGAGRLRPRDDV